jgi:MYXO-CTERM domain-containing protein
MTALACRRTVSLVAVFLTVILVVMTISGALAQAPTGPAPQARPGDTQDDDSGNWGLLGLLGLVGLAGLIRRDRTRPPDRPRV